MRRVFSAVISLVLAVRFGFLLRSISVPDAALQIIMETLAPFNVYPLELSRFPEDREYIAWYRGFINALISGVGALATNVATRQFEGNATVVEMKVGSTPVFLLYPTVRKEPVSHPLVFYFHGGGFVFGEANNFFALNLANELEAVVAAVAYPLAPETRCPENVLKAFEAFEFIASRSVELAFDADRIFVTGESAGGGMSAAVVQMAVDAGWRVNAQALFVPMLWCGSPTHAAAVNGGMRTLTGEMLRWFWRMYGCHRDEVALDSSKRAICSPVLATPEQLSRLPRTLVYTGSADALRDEGRVYVKKLDEAGVEVLHVEARGSHVGSMLFASESFDHFLYLFRSAVSER